MWAARAFFVFVPLAAIAIACGGEDSGADGSGGAGGSGASCPGAATACPAGCPPQELQPLTPSGCLGTAEVVACHAPEPPVTTDAGCVKRDADKQLFYVLGGGWPTVEGFEDCTNSEYGEVIAAPACTK